MPKCLKYDNLCQDCFDHICQICNKNELNGDYNNEKYCKKCDRTCCIECISLTGCQTIYGTCSECFDFLCILCDQKKLLLTNTYLIDHNENKPICNDCRSSWL